MAGSLSGRRVGAVAAVVLVLSALVAERTVLRGEVGATEALNDLPGGAIDALEVIMQLGARPAILLVAVVTAVLTGRGWLRAGVIVVLAGALAWFGAVLLKEVVERPRPAGAGAAVQVLDDADGSGFPSSHVAIATGSLAAATLVMGRRSEGALVAGAAVGLGRMAVGVHLPLDVVGGLALGVVAAVAVVEIAGRT